MSRVGEGMLITEYLGQGLIFHRGEREREEERERERGRGRKRERADIKMPICRV